MKDARIIHGNSAEYCRIDNDVNGNPRYVIHWLTIGKTYDEALTIARKFGGRKYRAKWYGGGIVFQSYNIDELMSKLKESKQ